MNALQHRQSSYRECHRWMGGREGGLKGAPASRRPPPRLLQCLDNIMLCVHLHNKYRGWVSEGRE